MVANKSTFKVIGELKHIPLKNNYVLILSNQEVTQDNGNSSLQLVMKKVQYSDDGSQRGLPKQLFLPLSDIPLIIKGLTSFYESIIKK